MTLDLLVSPDFGVTVCPVTSVLQWVGRKSLDFSLFSSSGCCEDESKNFQGPHLVALKPEALKTVSEIH